MATTTIPRPPAAAAFDTKPGRLRALVRGHAEDPAWARPAADRAAGGDADRLPGRPHRRRATRTASTPPPSQAGTKSWKAFFFGSIDSSNFITVDKPPASLWVMELSGRVFGFSSASMLVPQVLEGVLSVGLLFAACQALVRRRRRPAGRRGAGGDAGRGADVPLQQPGRADGLPDGRLGLLPGARARVGCGEALDARRRRAARLRLPGEDDGGVPGRAGLRARVPGGRARSACAGASATCCSAASHCWSRAAGGWRSSSSGRPARGR